MTINRDDLRNAILELMQSINIIIIPGVVIGGQQLQLAPLATRPPPPPPPLAATNNNGEDGRRMARIWCLQKMVDHF